MIKRMTNFTFILGAANIFTFLLLALSSYATVSDTSKVKFPTLKGDMKWTISLPYVNAFFLQPAGEPRKASIGFLGIATGFEYYYRTRKFLAIRGDGVMNHEVTVPVGVDYAGYYEPMTSGYVSITDNYVFNRYRFGYGINYAGNTWSLRYGPFGDPALMTIDEKVSKTQSFGLLINGYYQLTRRYFMGIIYRPSLLRTNPKTEFKYEHLITIDMTWKIR